MAEELSQHEIPRNSISCFIGRICEDLSDSFEEDGVIWVDLGEIDSDEHGDNEDEGPKHGESGTTQIKAIASWTLRAAYIAWNKPPKIKYKGKVKLKGSIKMSNAQLSNVSLSGGPPMQGTTTCGMGPGTSVTPVNISSATGSAKIEQSSNAEIEMETDSDNLDIELTSQLSAQLPWCVNEKDAEEGDEVDDGKQFIKKGDKALCLAFGNSLSNLFVVDVFR